MAGMMTPQVQTVLKDLMAVVESKTTTSLYTIPSQPFEGGRGCHDDRLSAATSIVAKDVLLAITCLW